MAAILFVAAACGGNSARTLPDALYGDWSGGNGAVSSVRFSEGGRLELNSGECAGEYELSALDDQVATLNSSYIDCPGVMDGFINDATIRLENGELRISGPVINGSWSRGSAAGRTPEGTATGGDDETTLPSSNAASTSRPTVEEPSITAETISLAVNTFPSAPSPIGSGSALSPNGNWLAYQNPDGQVCIEAIPPADLAAPCQTITGFGFRSLSWFADSSRFIGGDDFTQLGDTDTVVVSVDGDVDVLDDDGFEGELSSEVLAGTADALSGSVVTDDGRIFGFAYGRGAAAGQDVVELNPDGTWAPLSTLPGELRFVSGRLHQLGHQLVAGVEALDGQRSALAFIDLGSGNTTIVDFPAAETDRQPDRHVVDTAGSHVLTVKASLQDAMSINRDVAFYEIYDAEIGTLSEVSVPGDVQPSLAALSPDGERVAVVWDAAPRGAESTVVTLSIVDVASPLVGEQSASIVLSEEPLGIHSRSNNGGVPMCWCTSDRIVVAGGGVNAEVTVVGRDG